MIKQLSNDITSSGTFRLNTLAILFMQILPKFDVILNGDEKVVAVAAFNIAWKVIQKWMRGVGKR